MSFQAMTWAVTQKLPATQKIVLLMLANRVNHDTGLCIPRIKALAEECGLGETACKTALKALADKGLIRIEARFDEGVQKPNQYHLLMGDGVGQETTGVGRNATQGGAKRPKGGRKKSPGGASADPGVGRETPTEPGIPEPGIEPGNKPLAGPAALPVPTDEERETALQAACRETWAAYCDAYLRRYGTKPVRNQAVNSKVKQFVQRIGYDEAPPVAAFFVEQVNDAFVVRRFHEVGVLLSGAEGYRTQWATGRTMTLHQARDADRRQGIGATAESLKEKLRREGKLA